MAGNSRQQQGAGVGAQMAGSDRTGRSDAQRPVALIGAGFVADLYMRSFALYPGLRIAGVHDRNPERLATFCAHWGLEPFATAEALMQSLPAGSLVLNLTNPAEHAVVTRAALEAGHHVFSEKPMTLGLDEALELAELARACGLHLASAPSSVLGQNAQLMGRALREGVIGTPRLVYAELDDGFITQAPWQSWRSESGAPWPGHDEFAVGCTLEHAGYALSWLIAWFGPVTRVTSQAVRAAAGPEQAPDVSVAMLTFAEGPVARLTTTIIAPHDHQLRVIGDKGVLETPELWDNAAPVRWRRRMTLRRRLLETPLARRIRPRGPTHPKVGRTGAAAMNFALGPVEMLKAIEAGRTPRLAGDHAVHLTEVTLAIQAAEGGAVREMTTSCAPMEPMPWAR